MTVQRYIIFATSQKKSIEKMTDFFGRLDKYINYRDLNDNKISVQAGISNGLIGKGRKSGGFSLKNVEKLLRAYPELSADWLLTGNGQMLRHSYKEYTVEHNIVAEPQAEYFTPKSYLEKTVYEQTLVIKDLQKKINDLERKNDIVEGA